MSVYPIMARFTCNAMLAWSKDTVIEGSDHRQAETPLNALFIFTRSARLASDTFRPAILGIPFVQSRAADPVFATHVGHLRPAFLLSRNIPTICSSVKRLDLCPSPGTPTDGYDPYLERRGSSFR